MSSTPSIRHHPYMYSIHVHFIYRLNEWKKRVKCCADVKIPFDNLWTHPFELTHLLRRTNELLPQPLATTIQRIPVVVVWSTAQWPYGRLAHQRQLSRWNINRRVNWAERTLYSNANAWKSMNKKTGALIGWPFDDDGSTVRECIDPGSAAAAVPKQTAGALVRAAHILLSQLLRCRCVVKTSAIVLVRAFFFLEWEK